MMKKKRSSKTSLKSFPHHKELWVFYIVGRLTLKILGIYKNFFIRLLYDIIYCLRLVGRFFLLLFTKIGEFFLWLVASIFKLPSLPFFLLWEAWLFLKYPLLRQQRLKNWRKQLRFLAKSKDPGLRFVYVLCRRPYLLVGLLLFSFLSLGSFYYWVIKDLPSPDRLKNPPSLSTRIYARDCQTLLYKIYRHENRTLIPLSKIPQHVIKATLAIEDKEFYKHHGYSLSGILRAIKNNFSHEVIQGGSTITQQLIKNAVLSPERTYRRKIKELFLALQTELIFNKDQILQMYLNEVPYGGPAYGIEEASQMYFGKSVTEIDLAEASFLAGMPAAPSKFSPYLAGMTAAKLRQKEVLKQMVKAGFLNPKEARQIYLQELKILPPSSPIKAPHFVMYVKDELIKEYGEEKVNAGGLIVCTTLDPKVQEFAEKTVKEEINKIRQPYRVNNGAALITNPATGEILAMVGSADFWDEKNDGNVNLTTALRQPGSSIKIVNYSYALAHGYTPSSIIQDTPVAYRNPWETYIPRNYDGKFRGPVTLRSALAMSLNIPAVKVLASYGVEKMIAQAKKMGISTWNQGNYGLSLTLGAADVRMTDMAVVYGTVANLGKKVYLKPFRKVIDAQGRILVDIEAKDPNLRFIRKAEAAEGDGNQVISPQIAYQLIDILSDNEARTPAFGPNSDLNIKKAKVAVKTGTSNEMRDNWTIGFTPNWLVATWVGNNNNQPMSGIASGVTGASPIWNKLVNFLIDEYGAKEFATPSGLLKVKICTTTGTLTCKGCPKERYEYFLPGTEPKKTCSFPKPEECQALKAQLEAEGKTTEEITTALTNCPLN